MAKMNERMRDHNLDVLKEWLMSDKVIRRETHQLAGGGQSNVYFNVKSLFGMPEILQVMSETLSDNLHPETTAIAASGIGGIALAAAVSLETYLPLTIVRNQLKDHGTQELIEGYCPSPEDSISLIDDVFTTGSSLLKTVGNLTETEANILAANVVILRQDNQTDLDVRHIFRADELI